MLYVTTTENIHGMKKVCENMNKIKKVNNYLNILDSIEIFSEDLQECQSKLDFESKMNDIKDFFKVLSSSLKDHVDELKSSLNQLEEQIG